MGKKHHIGGAARILTFLVVVSIFSFHFYLIDNCIPVSSLWPTTSVLFFIVWNCHLKGSISKQKQNLKTNIPVLT